jgi:type I restriction enzyme S subunit
VPVIRGGNLPNGFQDHGFVFVSETKAEELRSAIARTEDVVFTHRGTLGQVGIIPTKPNYHRYIVSQSQMVLAVDKGKISPFIVYLFFRSPEGQGALLANTNQTGVPAIAQPTTNLRRIQLVVPSKDVSDSFDAIVRPLFVKHEQNAREADILTSVRDVLLPKLLSGEVRLPAAEKFIEASS